MLDFPSLSSPRALVLTEGKLTPIAILFRLECAKCLTIYVSFFKRDGVFILQILYGLFTTICVNSRGYITNSDIPFKIALAIDRGDKVYCTPIKGSFIT
jgi:hypothetical protein